MKLSPDQTNSLIQLMSNSFDPEGTELEALVDRALSRKLFVEFSAPKLPLLTIVTQLVDGCARKGLLGMLIKGVMDALPDRADLQTALAPMLAVFTQTPATPVEDVKQGLAAVGAGINSATVRAAVENSRVALEKLAGDVLLLRAYKSLHDSLHRLQMLLRRLARAARNLKNDAEAVTDLSECLTEMRTLAAQAGADISELPGAPPAVRKVEQDWLARLLECVDKVREALTKRDPDRGRQGVQAVKSLLRQEPPRIDRLLVFTADAVNLTGLNPLFESAAALPDVSAEETVALQQSQTAAEQLHSLLKVLVSQHTRWQGVDQDFWEAEATLPRSSADDPGDFNALWNGILERVAVLQAAEPASLWATGLEEHRRRMDELRTAEDYVSFKISFDSYRQESIVRFFVVDTELRGLAGKVATIGESLRKLLTELES